MRHKLQWFIDLQAHSLRKADEHTLHLPVSGQVTANNRYYQCSAREIVSGAAPIASASVSPVISFWLLSSCLAEGADYGS